MQSTDPHLQEEVSSIISLPASHPPYWRVFWMWHVFFPAGTRHGLTRMYFIKLHFANLSLRDCIRFHKCCITLQQMCLFHHMFREYLSTVFFYFKPICLHLNFNARESFSWKNFYFPIHIPGQLILKNYNQVILPRKKYEHLLLLVWVLVFCLFVYLKP